MSPTSSSSAFKTFVPASSIVWRNDNSDLEMAIQGGVSWWSPAEGKNNTNGPFVGKRVGVWRKGEGAEVGGKLTLVGDRQVSWGDKEKEVMGWRWLMA
jgi:hypothetical protein